MWFHWNGFFVPFKKEHGTGCLLELIVSNLSAHMIFIQLLILPNCSQTANFIHTMCKCLSLPPLAFHHVNICKFTHPHTHTTVSQAAQQAGRNHDVRQAEVTLAWTLVHWSMDGYRWSPHYLQPVHQWQVPLQPCTCYGDVGPIWAQRTASWAGQGINRFCTLKLLYYPFILLSKISAGVHEAKEDMTKTGHFWHKLCCTESSRSISIYDVSHKMFFVSIDTCV